MPKFKNDQNKSKSIRISRIYRTIGFLLFIISFLFGVGYIAYVAIQFEPKKVMISNISSRSATVSWVTSKPTKGFVRVGSKVFSETFYDDRDVKIAETGQTLDDNYWKNFSISVDEYGEYYTHHVTINNLEPETEYNFWVGNGLIYKKAPTLENYRNNAVNEYSFITSVETEPANPIPAYGQVLRDGPSLISVDDGIVYIKTEKGFASSAITSGDWYLDLSSQIKEITEKNSRTTALIESARYGRYKKDLNLFESTPLEEIIVASIDSTEAANIHFIGNSVLEDRQNLLFNALALDCEETGGTKPCSICTMETTYPECEEGTTHMPDGEEYYGYMEYCWLRYCPQNQEPEPRGGGECECACIQGEKWDTCKEIEMCQDHKCVPSNKATPQERGSYGYNSGSYQSSMLTQNSPVETYCSQDNQPCCYNNKIYECSNNSCTIKFECSQGCTAFFNSEDKCNEDIPEGSRKVLASPVNINNGLSFVNAQRPSSNFQYEKYTPQNHKDIWKGHMINTEKINKNLIYPGRHKVKYGVLHWTAGTGSRNSVASVINSFTKSETHNYGGVISANHCSNYVTEGNGTIHLLYEPGEACIQASQKVLNSGLTLSIENGATGQLSPSRDHTIHTTLTNEQVEANVQIIKECINSNRCISANNFNLVGHFEVPGSGKIDPGPEFVREVCKRLHQDGYPVRCNFYEGAQPANNNPPHAELDSYTYKSKNNKLIFSVHANENDETSITFSPEQNKYYFKKAGEYEIDYQGFRYKLTALHDNENYTIYFDSNNNNKFDEDIDVLLSKDLTDLKIKQTKTVYSYRLHKGINLISFPFIPKEKQRTASELIKYINANTNSSLYSIATWNDSWKVVGYNSKSYSNNDFDIIPGEGYLVNARTNTEIILDGQEIIFEKDTDKAPIHLNRGWNLIGLYGTSTKDYTAKSLLSEISQNKAPDFKAVNLSKWTSDKQKYEGLQRDEDNDGLEEIYGFDFPLSSKEGYFVKIEEGEGIWSPSIEK